MWFLICVDNITPKGYKSNKLFGEVRIMGVKLSVEGVGCGMLPNAQARRGFLFSNLFLVSSVSFRICSFSLSFGRLAASLAAIISSKDATLAGLRQRLNKRTQKALIKRHNCHPRGVLKT
ncbi:MAG: hypothetical protein ACE5I1_14200 [bacterium]